MPLGDGGGRRLQEAEAGPILRVTVLGFLVRQGKGVVLILMLKLICCTCHDVSSEMNWKCRLRFHIFTLRQSFFFGSFSRLSLFLPVIDGIRGSREFQDARLFASSNRSPESHAVGSLVEKIGYVLRARIETLGAKEAVDLIIYLVDLQSTQALHQCGRRYA